MGQYKVVDKDSRWYGCVGEAVAARGASVDLVVAGLRMRLHLDQVVPA